MTAAYIRNLCLNKYTDKPEYQMFTVLKPNLSKMSTFGMICIHQDKTKLDAWSDQGIFV